MRHILWSFVALLALGDMAKAGGLATLEFGHAFEDLGRLEIFDQNCNGGTEAAAIGKMKSRMIGTVAKISERAQRNADIWYQFGKLHQTREFEQQQCQAKAPTLDEIATLFQDALSYHRAGL